MAKTHRPQQSPASRTHRPVHRAGDGVLVDITPIPGPDGKTAVGIGVNLESAPVPDRRYIADVVGVFYRDDVLRLLFGQEKLSSGLRSLLVVQMNTAAAKHLISSVTEMKGPSLQEIAEVLGIRPATLADISEEPAQTVALSSSLAAVAISGRDACVDFYQISPFALAAARASHKIGVDPVVRVEIRTSRFMAMVDRLRQLQRDFPPDEAVVK